MLKILIVGDQFMNTSAAKSYAAEVLAEFNPEIETLEWEFRGYQKGRLRGVKQELREFTGTPEDLIKHMKNVEVLIVHLAPITKEVMEASGKLRVVGCMRGGPVNIDIDAATMLGIPVLRAPGRNAEAVADYTIGLIIAHVRNIVRACTLLKQGIWRDEFYFYEECGFELENKVLGIVGFGKVGREVAKRAKALQMRILAYDPYVSPNLMKSLGVEPTTLEKLLEESDVVTLHVRLTDETRHMIGERELKRMKPTAILVNTSRGEIVDEKALIKALNEGWIAGAALDVFEKEPLPPDHPFLKMDNVTITPHIAGASKEVVKRSVIMIAEDVKRLLKGEKPLYCVNPEVLEKEKAK
ncbi:hypothetical protein DRO64_00440 [Candidatus Bathyarchaeota archaeon]|nr:MAG: hypothetical protein DRO64_00440 [Candidatus Bathyarchaeota archaeon]